ncbi:coat protein [ssRNA phage Zoerhiza.2_25]|jgi:hypothetical protein|uniref:Coat protein n=2 Tax=Leviviricetes TaxID=2842243 RepID=A0A8S5KYL8_9VIRU|nr:coat protein [ssRNA phage Zoerhiza.2_25]QDH86476.1 MAG: hypothetical protein H2Rhizo33612_000002 [Leviviridae sp.]DAD50408.1 TPA_asm: coat protein [ssRNA phage Zoerhiza.2_25]
MALADPQSVTIGAATTPLPRVSTGANTSAYQSADSTVQLTASHSYGKRNRRTARVTSTKITVDPLLTNVNVRVSASAYVVIDVPPSGFSAVEQKDLLLSIATWLSASSGANAVKLIGGEN